MLHTGPFIDLKTRSDRKQKRSQLPQKQSQGETGINTNKSLQGAFGGTQQRKEKSEENHWRHRGAGEGPMSVRPWASLVEHSQAPPSLAHPLTL
ncbi:hypothetical protein CEXT_615911 [Caerostris extrusa]|uniref:Uncharacterized protein n=1 Tax=Caerostris extrusa TaxID=172846 RepID=A0AAV4SND0_CAEEX|nr:hypothetical protein CEXT_615911 [Caerostris extrusa]